jgi:subtilisin family serine protease
MGLILVVFGLLGSSSIQAKLTDELRKQIDDAVPDQMISCIVMMQEIYPYETMEKASTYEKVMTYKAIAEQSQKPVLEWLMTSKNDVEVYKSYWVLNGFYLKAKPEIIKEIAKRNDVAWISHNGEVHIIAEPSFKPAPSSRAIEWNIQKIMADSCWNAGSTGQDIIIGITDTGVGYAEPAIAGKWAGYWYDAINGQTTPYDDHGHGTHCMGTILGGDGFGPFTEDIGVAPGAKFVAAKILDSGGSGSFAGCLAGLQFMANLKDSVDIKAVSNSWGADNSPDTFFYPVIRTYVSIGIVPVFANGNSGPGSGSVCFPGSYSNIIGVGATDNNDVIADFSSRGPAPNQPPFNDPSTWLRYDWNLIKPQISAPGVNIRSCIPGGYDTWNGTSMATPHVTGAIALICGKNPTLDVKTIYDILLNNVDQPSGGAPYPNNNYGWGRLNVWKAVKATPSPNRPFIILKRQQITDPAPGGNDNGIVEAGETARLVVTLKNIGYQPGYNTTGILQSFDNYVSIISNSYNFGTIASQDSASNTSSPYTFKAHSLTPIGHTAKLGLIIHSDGQYDSLDFNDTIDIVLQIGGSKPGYAIFEDDFEYGSGIDSLLDYWDKVDGNWQRTTANYISPTHSLYSGPVFTGWQYISMKNGVDLSSFTDAQLEFWHKFILDSTGIGICGFWFVEASTDDWNSWDIIHQGNEFPLPYEYSKPWTLIDKSLTAYLGSNNLKVRFRLYSWNFNTWNDWWIDNFKILVPLDNEPPYFTNTTVWPDTTYTGPFPVQSTITDDHGIDSAYLYYRVNAGGWVKLAMVLQGADIYRTTIPQQVVNNRVDYYLWARDKWQYTTPNIGTDPLGAPADGYYSFLIKPLAGIQELAMAQEPSFMVISSNPVKGTVQFGYNLPAATKVNLTVYDVLGRQVRVLVCRDIAAGKYDVTWSRIDEAGRNIPSGIYFVHFIADLPGKSKGYSVVKKLILLR